MVEVQVHNLKVAGSIPAPATNLKGKIMKERYCDGIQIKEIFFTMSDIILIIKENILARSGTPYDFDYNNPIVIKKDDGLSFRFVQEGITKDWNTDRFIFKPIKKS